MKANYQTKYYRRGNQIEMRAYRKSGEPISQMEYVTCLAGGCNKKLTDTSDPDFDELDVPKYCKACAEKLGVMQEGNVRTDIYEDLICESSPMDFTDSQPIIVGTEDDGTIVELEVLEDEV